jgi:hypothetical protein
MLFVGGKHSSLLFLVVSFTKLASFAFVKGKDPLMLCQWCHDNQYNDTQRKPIHNDGLNCNLQHNNCDNTIFVLLGVLMLGPNDQLCHAGCNNAGCRYTEFDTQSVVIVKCGRTDCCYSGCCCSEYCYTG